jgi:hypothetical protein
LLKALENMRSNLRVCSGLPYVAFLEYCYLGFVMDFSRVQPSSLFLAFSLHRSCMLDSICPRKLDETNIFSITSDLNHKHPSLLDVLC